MYARIQKKIHCSRSRTAGPGNLTLDILDKVHSRIFQMLRVFEVYAPFLIGAIDTASNETKKK